MDQPRLTPGTKLVTHKKHSPTAEDRHGLVGEHCQMAPEDPLHSEEIDDESIVDHETEQELSVTTPTSSFAQKGNNYSCWKHYLKQLLRSKKQAGAATLVTGVFALIAWISHRSYKRRAKERILSYRSARTVPLSLLLTLIDEGRLRRALLGTSRVFFQSVEAFNNEVKSSQTWARVDLPSNITLQKQLFARLAQLKTVDITTIPESDYTKLLSWILAGLPFVYLALVYRMMKNQFGDKDRHKSSFEHRRKEPETRTTFQDVAGLDFAVSEVSEVVQFLRDPEKYRRVGASTPAGVLLHGPPGTGKTLLAQAVAGEASVDCFLACSASDFVELYVGRGASRIRSLFKELREEALRRYSKRTGKGLLQSIFGADIAAGSVDSCCSAILFIDELDALAKTRSSLGSNDEREQTLNQLLTEMEGFQRGNVTVIVMAATNRVDVLDPAILRRFDRHIHVGYPDEVGRERILQVQCKRVLLEGPVDFGVLSSATVDFSGAELRTVVNEAALLAVRQSSKVTQIHLEEAARKVQKMKSSLRSFSSSTCL